MINRVVLVGRLTRDPVLRYTQSGAAVTSFTLAVNRQFTNTQGERDADFINCAVWRKAAEIFNQYTHKGSLVSVDGRIQTSSYDNQQGQRVYRTDVIVENFSFLDSHNDEQQNQTSTNGQNNQIGNNNQRPTSTKQQNTQVGNRNSNANSINQQNNQTDDPFANNSRPIDISDDDLPF